MREIHSAALPFDPKHSVTSRLRLRGEYADERGRATIIAGITNPEQVDYLHLHGMEW